jgi:hypothetical protein
MRQTKDLITREATDAKDQFNYALRLMTDNRDNIWKGAASDTFYSSLKEICRSGASTMEQFEAFSDYIEERATKYEEGHAAAMKVASSIEQAVWADVDTGMA